MSDVIESFAVNTLGDEDVNIVKTVSQDVSAIKADAAYLRANCGNGFTEGRTMRHIASVPIIEIENAIRMGFDISFSNSPDDNQKELFRYLNTFAPEYMTVDRLVHHNANDGHIFVK